MQSHTEPPAFVAAIIALQRTWIEVDGESEWQDVRVVEDVCHAFRTIRGRKMLILASSALRSAISAHCAPAGRQSQRLVL